MCDTGPFEHWDRGFESRSTEGCMSEICAVLSCVNIGFAMD